MPSKSLRYLSISFFLHFFSIFYFFDLTWKRRRWWRAEISSPFCQFRFARKIEKGTFHEFLVLSPGVVDFTKLFCQAKSCRQTAFGKKLKVQFHQQSSKAKIKSKFAKLCTPFAKCHSPKKKLNLVRKCWWNWPLV